MFSQKNKGNVQLIGLVVFSVTLMVLILTFSKIEGSISVGAGEATYAKQNASNNTWSAVQLSTVGPIIIGAVLVLSIIGLLYSRR